MSRSLSCFGFALVLAGAAGAVHQPNSDFSARAPATAKSNSAYPTRALDLQALTLSDFGDEEK